VLLRHRQSRRLQGVCTMIRLSPFALAGALIATSVTVAAVSPANAAVERVRFADLDLTSAHGRATLASRINNAAMSVCLADYRDLNLARSCQKSSVARAQADVRQATQDSTIQLASR
jgi:UrcA family protein